MNRETQDTAPRESRLEHFPITILPTVMGLTGLAIVLFKFEHVFAVNIPLGSTVLYAVTVWFALVLGVYAMKLIRYPDQVKAEFRHPIRVNFFPAISICFLLLSIGYVEAGANELARVFWLIGTPLHLVFLLIILYRWFHKAHHITHSTRPGSTPWWDRC